VWKRLSLPNGIPLLGVTDYPTPLSMVLEWMPNGEIETTSGSTQERIGCSLYVTPILLCCMTWVLTSDQLLDVCHGLQILRVVHGNLV